MKKYLIVFILAVGLILAACGGSSGGGEDELAKERRVVIEELNQSNDSPGAQAEAG